MMSTVDAASRLDIENLSRSFGETRALRSATLRVAPGEIHSLAGENGSGKSTLIKILSGVLRPDSGTLTWEGDVKRHLTSPSGAQPQPIPSAKLIAVNRIAHARQRSPTGRDRRYT